MGRADGHVRPRSIGVAQQRDPVEHGPHDAEHECGCERADPLLELGQRIATPPFLAEVGHDEQREQAGERGWTGKLPPANVARPTPMRWIDGQRDHGHDHPAPPTRHVVRRRLNAARSASVPQTLSTSTASTAGT